MKSYRVLSLAHANTFIIFVYRCQLVDTSSTDRRESEHSISDEDPEFESNLSSPAVAR
jgi:hypothetical protein